MNLKYFLILSIIIFSLDCISQIDSLSYSRHSGAVQFGGQTTVSMNYEYLFLLKKRFSLSSNIGLGLNENGDEVTREKPIYAIQTGIICLIGTKRISLELDLNPSTYFNGPTTFVNLNGWTGIRIYPKKMDGFFFSFGYTPRIYTTWSDPTNHFFNAIIGMKAGINF